MILDACHHLLRGRSCSDAYSSEEDGTLDKDVPLCCLFACVHAVVRDGGLE